MMAVIYWASQPCPPVRRLRRIECLDAGAGGCCLARRMNPKSVAVESRMPLEKDTGMDSESQFVLSADRVSWWAVVIWELARLAGSAGGRGWGYG